MFWINSPDGGGYGLKIIESKNRHHFEKPTFLVLQLCASDPFWFRHFKCFKNAPCLWFGLFSSREKRCTHACLHRFTRELKRPNQRQGAFLRHLKCTNHPGYEAQSCSTQKVDFQSSVLFLFWCILDHGLCHLVDLFKKFPMDEDFIWLGWIDYNSSIHFHVATSRPLRKKPKCCLG